MESSFAPEIFKAPFEQTGLEILSQLPSHYLENPTPSNLVALGAVYVIMGMGLPEGCDQGKYLDKALMAVFTALNDRAASMNLPAYEPPTPISEHPANTHISALIDNLMTQHQASSSHLMKVARTIFSSYTPGCINHWMDMLRKEHGIPLTPSVSDPEAKGEKYRWDYDGVFYNTAREIGIPEDLIPDIQSQVILTGLQLDSQLIRKADPTIGPIGPLYNRSIGYLIINARRALDVDKDRHHLDGAEPDFDSHAEDASVTIDPSSLGACLHEFHGFVTEKGAPILADMLSLQMRGVNAKGVKEALHLSPSSYTNNMNKIKDLGRQFLREVPRYADLLEPLLYS